jgi:tRNA(His) guanylyltransferase
VYSHKQLLNCSCAEMQEMLFQKGINWSQYPAFFKRGTYVQKKKVIRRFTQEELKKLPLKHTAHQNPGVPVERTNYIAHCLPPITKILNKEQVIFGGETPLTERS